MSCTNVSPREGNPVQKFVSTFLVPTGHTHQNTKERLVRWIQIANNPSKFVPPGATERDIAELHRKARQNVRRLAARHPDVANEILATVKPGDLQ